MRLVVAYLSSALGCGFQPAASPSDAPRDAVIVPDGDATVEVLRSCKAIHDGSPALPSGQYTIQADGSTPVTVECDMSTDGGGWTVVFMAQNPNVTGIPVAYVAGLQPVLTAATKALIAYRTSSFVAAPGSATFALPDTWRTDTPFDAPGSDVPTDVSVDGAGASPATLRFGSQTFTTRCEDPWSNTGLWGRVCIVGTAAPFFNGFASPSADKCSNSLSVYDATPCAGEVLFSIAVR